MAMSLPTYKKYISGLDTETLGKEIDLLATKKRDEVMANNSYQETKTAPANIRIIHMQRKLHACFEECMKRGEIGLYTQNYIKTRLNPLCNVHPDPEKLAALHMLYKFPGHAQTKKASAVNMYAEDGATINMYMRRGNNLGGYDPYKKTLQKIMQPTPFDITLFRGFGLEQTFKAGDRFIEKGFMGMSGAKSVAHNFANKRLGEGLKCYTLQIEVPKGTPYISIWNAATQFKDYVDAEQEILLGDNLTLEMVKRISGKAHDESQEWQARIILDA